MRRIIPLGFPGFRSVGRRRIESIRAREKFKHISSSTSAHFRNPGTRHAILLSSTSGGVTDGISD